MITAQDLLDRAKAHLTLDPPTDILAGRVEPPRGDHRIDGHPFEPLRYRAAAVLIGVVDHPGGATVLLTRRVDTLRAHAGQIALPGGRIDPGDRSPAAAALREAEEEVGLDPAQVTPIGYLDPYATGTGFLVVPTVARVAPPLRLTLNPAEVASSFEVPLSFLMQPDNHQRDARVLGGRVRHFYVMPYGEYRIWGITAGILRSLYERLYAP